MPHIFLPKTPPGRSWRRSGPAWRPRARARSSGRAARRGNGCRGAPHPASPGGISPKFGSLDQRHAGRFSRWVSINGVLTCWLGRGRQSAHCPSAGGKSFQAQHQIQRAGAFTGEGLRKVTGPYSPYRIAARGCCGPISHFMAFLAPLRWLDRRSRGHVSTERTTVSKQQKPTC